MKTAPLLASVAAPALVRRTDRTFSDDLTIEDRRRLRAIVVKTHQFCFRETPTAREVDKLIDALGPEVGRKMVLQALADNKVG